MDHLPDINGAFSSDHIDPNHPLSLQSTYIPNKNTYDCEKHPFLLAAYQN